jgi:hypothetical protein
MATNLFTTTYSRVGVSEDDSFLYEHQAQEDLFRVQSNTVQRALEFQASLIAKAVTEHQSPLHFRLPEQVACQLNGTGELTLVNVPVQQREQKVGGLLVLLKSADLNRRLKDLENSPEKAVSTCGQLLRYVVARRLVYRMLPQPQRTGSDQRLLSGYALSFFMPQWVALDDQDNLLVNSVAEAWACIQAMQRFLSTLTIAVGLAPYFIVDEEYQRKRIGVLAQLLNQGQALARHETASIIVRIKRRVREHTLDRGFDLDLPFFDDQALEIRKLNIPVIPHGRIQFVPAFVVIAARVKQMEIEHSPGLSHTTRKHLLEEIKSLIDAFDDPAD